MKVMAPGTNSVLGFVQTERPLLLHQRAAVGADVHVPGQPQVGGHLLQQDHFHSQDILGIYDLTLCLATICAIA